MKDTGTPLQYDRATLRKLKNAFSCVRVNSTAAQECEKNYFDKKVGFWPAVCVGKFFYTDSILSPLKNIREQGKATR